jgi:hypothetical protein
MEGKSHGFLSLCPKPGGVFPAYPEVYTDLDFG